MTDNGEQRGANPTLLKRDIDTGATGDKVNYPDPAASPLGTDDEAAGTPVTQTQLDMARQTERVQGRQAGPRDADFGAAPSRSGRATIVLLAGIAAIVLLLVALL